MSTAAAAFQLGFYAYRFDADEIEKALSILCVEMPNNVHSGLIQACNRPSRNSCEIVENLADLAFPPSLPAYAYYQLGKTLAVVAIQQNDTDELNAALPAFWEAVDQIPVSVWTQECSITLLNRAKRNADALSRTMQEVVDSRNIASDEDLQQRKLFSELLSELPSNVQKSITVSGPTIFDEFAQEVLFDLGNWQASPRLLSPNDPRDRWIYEHCMQGTPYMQIIHELGQHKDWEPIDSPPGIRAAAERYSKRHGLEAPPKRRRGRPQEKNKRDQALNPEQF